MRKQCRQKPKAPKNCLLTLDGEPSLLIEEEKIPDTTKVGDILELTVGEVFTPSLFWFQLREKEHPLAILMDKMK